MKLTNQEFQIAQINFKLANILYRNAPIFGMRVISTIIVASSMISMSILLFSSAFSAYSHHYEYNLSSFDLVGFLIFDLIISIFLFVIFFLDVEGRANREVNDKTLKKIITQIKKSGLIEHFLQNDLFQPISNPYKPILYSDVENIYLIAKQEFELQNSLNNQKKIINQCLD